MWVGARKMTAGICVWNHDAGPRDTVQTPRLDRSSSAQSRLCTLRAPFRRDFVHWGGSAPYKPPPEQALQCAKSHPSLPDTVTGPERLARPPRTPISEAYPRFQKERATLRCACALNAATTTAVPASVVPSLEEMACTASCSAISNRSQKRS